MAAENPSSTRADMTPPPAAPPDPPSAPGRPRTKSRSVGLDAMRFAAVMLVLYTHANMFGPTKRFFLPKVGLLYDALYALRVGAWVGVDLFFVLSGFLISGLMFQELGRTGGFSPGRFLIRRGFKIYPMFWFLLAVTITVRYALNQPVTVKMVLTELCFLQNYVLGPPPTYIPSFWGVTWTLAVEEHFYFLLAAVFYFLTRRSGADQRGAIHLIPKLFLGVAGGCLVLRCLTCALFPLEPQTRFLFLYATHVRMDSLFCGVLISYYWHYRWDEPFKQRLYAKRWLFCVAGLALLYPALYQDTIWYRTVGFVCAYAGAGYLLLSFLSLDRSQPNFCVRFMAWLGRHSYAVYLWHIPASHWLLPWITFKSRTLLASSTNLLIYFAMCWAVGITLSWLLEFPLLRVRDRFFPWLGARDRPAAVGAVKPAS